MSKVIDFKNNFGLRSGPLLIAEIALVSFIMAVGLLIVSVTRAVKRYRLYGGNVPDESLQPVGVLFLFAIFTDSIQAMGNILSARWAYDGEITEGSYCSTQAVLKQFGNNGVAWSTIAIAVITFLQVVFPRTLLPVARAWVFVYTSIAFIFLFLILIITIPASIVKGYYGNTGLWCWIKDGSTTGKRMEFGSEYAFFWLAAAVTLLLYGFIVIRWWREAAEDRDPRLMRDALAMGWYPIAYLVQVVPQSVVRFLTLRPQGGLPIGWTILTSALFASSGAVNVTLWLVTGRQFGFTRVPTVSHSLDEDGSSYGSPKPSPHEIPMRNSLTVPAHDSSFPPDGSSRPHEVYSSQVPYQWSPYEQDNTFSARQQNGP